MSSQIINSATSMTNNALNSLSSGLNQANETVNTHLQTVSQHSIGKIVLHMIVILYASLVAPKISSGFAPYISNMYFKIAFMSLIAWVFTKDPTLSILVAVGYFLTISYLTKNSMSEVEETGEMSENVAQALESPAPVPAPLAPPAPLPAQVQQADAVEEAAVPLITATGDIEEPIPSGLEPDSITAAPVPSE